MSKAAFVQTYGCQMNVRDSEEAADLILYNTCSVREQAENRVWSNVSEGCQTLVCLAPEGQAFLR